jgi:hypothetical protein
MAIDMPGGFNMIIPTFGCVKANTGNMYDMDGSILFFSNIAMANENYFYYLNLSHTSKILKG